MFMLQGVYGPFQPPSKATVPLWLALSLKRKRKCRIVGPEWLTVGEHSTLASFKPTTVHSCPLRRLRKLTSLDASRKGEPDIVCTITKTFHRSQQTLTRHVSMTGVQPGSISSI